MPETRYGSGGSFMEPPPPSRNWRSFIPCCFCRDRSRAYRSQWSKLDVAQTCKTSTYENEGLSVKILAYRYTSAPRLFLPMLTTNLKSNSVLASLLLRYKLAMCGQPYY